ncbi:TRAP dicarboxylate transporter, DctQ subunit [Caenispirillum salinarum AK4]|uniref:TRAP transporter small permease protein n=1 Tax=Caenispirillum salinarum AK4 TaxID=1238182 RepID=K9HT60_9PROT|nr:TRAP transporter small permease [Caenispirillum salinarum]EKV31486.1 TRAP dicarboxylate transporter, DctQ subunit [Caenispirillum salinarum AK4]
MERRNPPPGGRDGKSHPVLNAISILDTVLAKVETFILAYGILLMFLNTIGNVIGRYLFGQSLYFSEELNQFLIVLVTFVGLGYATRRGRHIRMSAFYDQLSDRGRKILMIIIAAVTGAVMFWLSWISYEYVASVANSGKVTPALRVPLYLTYLWVPFGFFLTGIQYALTVLRNLRDPDVWISWEAVDSYDEIDGTAAGSGEDRE